MRLRGSSRRRRSDVGLDEVVQRSGVAKATLYRHFPRRKTPSSSPSSSCGRSGGRTRWSGRPARRGGEEGALLAIFDVFAIWIKLDDFRACAFINVLLELGRSTQPGEPASDISRTSAGSSGHSPRKPELKNHENLSRVLVHPHEGLDRLGGRRRPRRRRARKALGRLLIERHRWAWSRRRAWNSSRPVSPRPDGWFVVNVRDGAWVTNEALGDVFVIEGEEEARFPDVGFTLAVSASRSEHVPPRGKPGGLPRPRRRVPSPDRGRGAPLKAWDFVHCPPGTEHIFVGAGDGPCVIFMVGAREAGRRRAFVYPRSEAALRHGAGVEEETTVPAKACLPRSRVAARPRRRDGLPWAGA